MALDFQQVKRQVIELGDRAPGVAKEREALRTLAWKLLGEYADEQDQLRKRVEEISARYDPGLRCAVPPAFAEQQLEALNERVSLPTIPEAGTVLASDGSQIAPDRHAEVNYCLINVGTIQLSLGSDGPPSTSVQSELFYDQGFTGTGGVLSEARLALERDLRERKAALELPNELSEPLIAITDGPMELWGAGAAGDAQAYRDALAEYRGVLNELQKKNITAAGYVDKPAANLVVRLLETLLISETDLENIRNNFPLRGVTDIWLFQTLLNPGERSAVLAIQSKSANSYEGHSTLHFFYLNVGSTRHPWIARVEVPAWVVENQSLLDGLHAVLVEQSRIIGGRPYPYLLHRAHETAVVSVQEKETVTQMIVQELRRRGVEVDEISSKQASKNLSGRTRY